MDEAGSYVAKWLARQPEMELAEGFCAPPLRPAFRLWGALLNELDEAVYELSDASVTQAKLAWWGEELVRGSAGGARHPLVAAASADPALRALPTAHWSALAFGALQVAQDDRRGADVSALIDAQQSYAAAIAAVETTLFGGDVAAVTNAIAIERMLHLAQQGTLRWPMQLLARHQADADALAKGSGSPATRALMADLARQLLDRLATESGGVFRRSRTALLRHRLATLARGRTPDTGRFRMLWLLWRAARRAVASKT